MQNKSFIPFLLTSLVSATAQAAPTFYGQLNLGLSNQLNAEDERVWQVENQASRLGLKGTHALENNLTFIYQYEVGIDPSSSAKPILSQRNTFAGVKTPYGQVIFGTFDTPLKLAQNKVDLFNDTALDMSALMAGEVRHEQSVQYSSPKFFDALSMSLDWLPAADATQKDGLSVAVQYQQPSWSATLAADQYVAGDAGVLIDKTTTTHNYRAVFSFQPINAVKLGLLAQLSEGVEGDRSREQSWLASASWQVQKFTVKGQVGQGDADKDSTGAAVKNNISQLSLGLDYALGDNTLAYAYSGLEENTDPIGKKEKQYVGGLGVKYKF